MNKQIQQLEQQRKVMIDYLKMRLEMNDLHGVRDSATDIEVIDAKLSILRSLPVEPTQSVAETLAEQARKASQKDHPMQKAMDEWNKSRKQNASY